MAKATINLQKESGGIVKISPVDGTGVTEVTVPESGNLVSVDTAVTDNAIARYDGTTGKLQDSGVIIDDNGNVGIDVTPSAWSFKALDIGLGTAIVNTGSYVTSIFAANCYFNGEWKYKNNEVASLYEQQGLHKWYIAPSGTAGNPITWSTAMMLNTNGNLFVGTSVDNGVDKLQVNGSISSGTIFTITSGDLNNYKTITQVIGTYPTMSNIPINDHGYLEVIVYSPNIWVMQRFTTLGTSGIAPGRVFVRCLVNGVWSAWVEK